MVFIHACFYVVAFMYFFYSVAFMYASLCSGFYGYIFFNTVAFIRASYLIVKHALPRKFYEEMTAALHTDNKPEFVFLYGT